MRTWAIQRIRGLLPLWAAVQMGACGAADESPVPEVLAEGATGSQVDSPPASSQTEPEASDPRPSKPPPVDDAAVTSYEIESCLLTPLGNPKHTPIEVELGWVSGNVFKPFEDGDTVEIVQGPQGGIHLDVFQGPAVAKIQAVTVTPCCGPSKDSVGSFLAKKYPLMEGVEAPRFYTDVLQVMFDQPLANHYADAECCVQAIVSIYDLSTDTISHSGSDGVRLLCRDLN